MIFYRIGCIVLVLTGLLHLSSHLKKTTPTNETEKQLLVLMETYQVEVAGTTVTMHGIMEGFGLWFSLSLIWLGVLSLFLVKQLGENRVLIRKIAGINASALLIGTGLSLLYFFFIPTICLALGLVFFSLATIRLK
jgi:hypothetical protein